MENNVLKLIVKKDVFDNIEKGVVSAACFETSPFYMGKFTTSKNNTVDMLKKDDTLYKSFDRIEFSCISKSINKPFYGIGLSDDTIPQFVVVFSLSDGVLVADNTTETTVKITDGKTPLEILKETHVKDETNVTEETKPDAVPVDVKPVETSDKPTEETETNKTPNTRGDWKTVLNKIYKKPNVYLVNSLTIRIMSYGRIMKCDRTLNIRNENEHMEFMSFTSFHSPEELKKYFDGITASAYVFVAPNEMIFDKENDTISLPFREISKLKLLNLL